MLFRIAAFSALGLEYNVWQNFLNVQEETKLATNQDDAPHRVVWFNSYTILKWDLIALLTCPCYIALDGSSRNACSTRWCTGCTQ
jgi:hypothetical protein